jgi:hypothetical protein
MSDKKPTSKPKAKPEARKKPMTELELHHAGKCDCGKKDDTSGKPIQPNFCVYQPFLDGWNFTPDVGNGQKRGEVFTPRFVVDKMIVMSGMLPEKAVYHYDYSGATETLRNRIGQRIFEPAVGTANFAATILWHKLEYANMLSSDAKQASDNSEDVNDIESIIQESQKPKTPAQLRRYQAYTLVALASIYINDIDAGNLQTSKHRFLRLSEINNDENIEFWVKHIQDILQTKADEEAVLNFVTDSIKTASKNWGAFDRNRGVLDDLYYKHTKSEPPTWLVDLWKLIMDENAKLFNGIVLEDTVEEGFIVPGYRNIVWNFWWFTYDKSTINVAKRRIPLYRQMLDSKISELQSKANSIYNRGVFNEVEDGQLPMEIEGVSSHRFSSEQDEKEYKALTREIVKLKEELKIVPQYGEPEYMEVLKTDS